MKALLAALAALGVFAAMTSTVTAQVPGLGGPGTSPSVGNRPYATPTLPFAQTPSPTSPGINGAPGATPGPNGNRVYPSTAVLPEPTRPSDIKPSTLPLPNDPIEPYLLTKDNGPFMVMAKSFRGPDAERFALALALELRHEYGLPAYILRSKDFPMHSNIRNVPPTADVFMKQAQLTDPEKTRTYDEAVVLVGNEKTLKGSEQLWHVVKKIKPKCLQDMPQIYAWRQGLSKALRTTNPYVPAQMLYPNKPVKDPLISQMNGGPFSVVKCSGHYSLQIAEFGGRATFNTQDPKFIGSSSLKGSPLATAHADAEKMAAALSKVPEIKQTGQPVFVYHDRSSSRVLIGSFSLANDPVAGQLRDHLLKVAVQIMDQKDVKTGRAVRGHDRGIDRMIVPANYLTDVVPMKDQLRK